MVPPSLRIDPHSQPSPHILPLGPRVCLEIVRGRVRQRVRKVRGRVFLIGAAHDCDLVLADPAFPEAYAYLFIAAHRVTVRWLGVGPELLVAGERAEHALLHDGDEIAFGPFALVVRIQTPPPRSHFPKRNSDTPSPTWLPELEDPPPQEEVNLLLAEVRRTVSPPPTPPPCWLPLPAPRDAFPRRASA